VGADVGELTVMVKAPPVGESSKDQGEKQHPNVSDPHPHVKGVTRLGHHLHLQQRKNPPSIQAVKRARSKRNEELSWHARQSMDREGHAISLIIFRCVSVSLYGWNIFATLTVEKISPSKTNNALAIPKFLSCCRGGAIFSSRLIVL